MLLPKRLSQNAPQDSSSPRRLNLPRQYENDEQSTARRIVSERRIRNSRAAAAPYVAAAGKVLGSLGAPQRKMMQALAGTEQTPSQWLAKKGVLNPNAPGRLGMLNRAVGAVDDAVFDPVNLLGVGIARKLSGARVAEQAGSTQRMLLTAATEAQKAELTAIAAKFKNRPPLVRQRVLLDSSPAIPKDVATRSGLLPEGAAQRGLQQPERLPAGLASPGRPSRLPSGSGLEQSSHAPNPGLAKPFPRDVYDIHLEEGTGRPLYKEGDEVKRWDAEQRGAWYDDARYSQSGISRNYVAAREARMQQPGGAVPQPATMQESAQYTREANNITPSSLRTERSRVEDAKATHWAINSATEQQFKRAAEADGTGNVAQRLAQFRQNIQYPLFEALLADNLSGLQFAKTKRIFLNSHLPDAHYARTAEHEIGHASQLIGRTREASLLPDEFDRLAQARLNTPRANAADIPTKEYPTGYHREPEEIASRLREVRGALQKQHGQPVPLREYLQEMRNSHPETHRSIKPNAGWQAINRLPLSLALPAVGGTAVLGVQRKDKGGLLPTKLTMLGPDGKPQMELGGGNRIFSRANTRELVDRSLKAKTPAELKELGGRIRQMLDKQDRNKPEYVKD